MTELPRPADVLPHRPPFLFVTEITAVDPGVSARGRWELTAEEAFFGGHFPGRPTLPGVLMVGMFLGFILGTRAARNAFDLQQKRETERAAAREARAAKRAADKSGA